MHEFTCIVYASLNLMCIIYIQYLGQSVSPSMQTYTRVCIDIILRVFKSNWSFKTLTCACVCVCVCAFKSRSGKVYEKLCIHIFKKNKKTIVCVCHCVCGIREDLTFVRWVHYYWDSDFRIHE